MPSYGEEKDCRDRAKLADRLIGAEEDGLKGGILVGSHELVYLAKDIRQMITYPRLR